MQQEIHEGEVWLAEFPYEENPTKHKNRPVVVLSVDDNICKVLSTKVTSKQERDHFDVKIIYWAKANLKCESVARVSKTILIPMSQFKFKIGDLDEKDKEKIEQLFMEYIAKNA